MKTLSEYLALPYHMEIIEDHDESGYIASFPELHGVHVVSLVYVSFIYFVANFSH